MDGIEPLTGQTALVYGYTNAGMTNLVAFEATYLFIAGDSHL